MMKSEDYDDSEFDDITTRMTFVRKVFAILMAQLAFVTIVIGFVRFYEPANLWMKEHFWLIFIGAALNILITLSFCFGVVRKTFPINVILLVLYTISHAIVLSIATLFYQIDHIIIALCITVIVCFVLILFACQTKVDFTVCWVLPLVLLVILISFGIFVCFYRTRITVMIYSAFGAAVISYYLVIDVQLIMGGRKREISPEDYVLAVMKIFTDIIMIFLYILRFIRALNS